MCILYVLRCYCFVVTTVLLSCWKVPVLLTCFFPPISDTMAKGEDLSSPVTNTRHRDSLSVVFDKESPPSACARSRSRSSGGSSRSSGSDRHRGRGRYRGRNRSPSSSSSSRSTSRPRSRSYPRCHRPSSRCRCDNHPTYGRNRYRRSPPRRYRPHSRSCSRSPPSNKHSHRRHYRSRSRSQRGVSRYNRADNRFGGKFPRSPSRSHRSRARSRSAESSVSLTVEGKLSYRAQCSLLSLIIFGSGSC